VQLEQLAAPRPRQIESDREAAVRVEQTSQFFCSQRATLNEIGAQPSHLVQGGGNLPRPILKRHFMGRQAVFQVAWVTIEHFCDLRETEPQCAQRCDFGGARQFPWAIGTPAPRRPVRRDQAASFVQAERLDGNAHAQRSL
jgi:hypothetical protein